MTKNFSIGDVYFIHFSGDEHEQNGWRSGVVFQNNTGNVHSPNVIVLPMTSSVKKIYRKIPTHVVVYANDSGLKKDSVVLCENPVSVSKTKCGNYLTTIPDKYMKEIAAAYLIATSALAFIDINVFSELKNKCISLNMMCK